MLVGRLILKSAPSPLCQDRLVCQERHEQENLPHSADRIWPMLKACQVSYDKQTDSYALVPTPAVKALEGQRLRVSGFALPLDGTDQTKHFLIGVNTPVCFYHPPGDPNEIIEVLADQAVTWGNNPMAVEGTFTLIDNSQMGVFFRLTDAKPA